MKTSFPPNPTDKMLYEAYPGVIFQYSAGSKSWTRLQGYGEQKALATPLADGLMSKEDLKKLNGLLVPPPRTALASEDCDFIFKEGVFGFRSSQDHLFIETELSLVDKLNNETKKVWKIHENTYGINFRINLPRLVSDLEARGRLTYHKSVGLKGKKGKTGKRGQDKLDTGPRGPTGYDGKNSPFPGFLSAEAGALIASDGNRGIVDVYPEIISPDENYLIAIRANIANPDYCPTTVRPKNVNSKWIVVTDERPVARVALSCNQNPASNPTTCSTGGPGCGAGSSSIVDQQTVAIQSFCSTRLYYLDMTQIEQAIKERFDELVAELKKVKEQLVLDWLRVMIDVFNEQKLALCCAIENCESRRENQDHRRYIESQRVQGAIAGVSLEISGPGGKGQTVVNTNLGKNCPPGDITSGGGTDVGTGTGGGGTAPGTDPNGKLVATLVVDCSKNSTTEEQAVVSADIPAGVYKVLTTTCCCYSSEAIPPDTYEMILADPAHNTNPAYKPIVKELKPYTGRVALVHYHGTNKVTTMTPNYGSFKTAAEAQKAYAPSWMEFWHSGGVMKAYFPYGTPASKTMGNSGTVQLDIHYVSPLPDTLKSMDRDVVEFVGTGTGTSVDPCAYPVLEADISCKYNCGKLNAIVATLPVGDYVAELTDCCCNATVSTQDAVKSGITGTVGIEYNSNNGVETAYNTDWGAYDDLQQALTVYLGSTIAFSHIGGEIKIWTTIQGQASNHGKLKLAIKKHECIDVSPPTPLPPPPVFQSCEMTVPQLSFYEAGWNSKSCCGACVDVGGSKWLVIKRSIGTDISCGGGESPESDCIKKSAEFGFHPYMAFPTVDGKSFFGKPMSGGQLFVSDYNLEAEIKEKILNQQYIEKVGDFDIVTMRILFPYEA